MLCGTLCGSVCIEKKVLLNSNNSSDCTVIWILLKPQCAVLQLFFKKLPWKTKMLKSLLIGDLIHIFSASSLLLRLCLYLCFVVSSISIFSLSDLLLTKCFCIPLCVGHLYDISLPLCYNCCPITKCGKSLALLQDKLLLLAVSVLLELILFITLFQRSQRETVKSFKAVCEYLIF